MIVDLVVKEFVETCGMTNHGHYQVLCLELDNDGELGFSIQECIPGDFWKNVFPLWIYKSGNKVSPARVIKNRVEVALEELEPASNDLLGDWGRSVLEKWEGKWGGVA